MKKIRKSALIVCGALIASGFTISDYTRYNYENTIYAESSLITVAGRTQDEIKNYISEHPFSTYSDVSYDEMPSVTSPYSLGKVSDESLENALNCLNVMRYIAGLDEVQLKDEYNQQAQAASVVNAANGSLSHSPEKPSGMSDEMYELGYEGAGSSNIGYGYTNIADSILSGYMYDGNSGNISRIGHRRWCLNPVMEYTGFGMAGVFTAMYSFDNWYMRDSTNIKGVCWPAQNMPVQYFSSYYPWSISIGDEINPANIKVTLTRKSDSAVWSFSSDSSDGEFYVDNQGYGQIGCIIFRPENIDDYADGDVFTVEIDGLDAPLSYTVNFFDAEKTSEEEFEKGDVNGDGVIDVFDLSAAKHGMINGFSSTASSAAADINNNGINDAEDILLIKEYLLGM